MQMRPVVDRLQGEFAGRVAFRYVNALDGEDGEAAFKQLALPGHPAYVLFKAGGAEAFRTFGIVDETALQVALAAALDSS